VNLASRLQSLTKRGGVDVLIDGNTRDQLGARAQVKRATLSRVRGRLQKVRVYFLAGLDESAEESGC
jgi:class 3 adenylate cyclase